MKQEEEDSTRRSQQDEEEESGSSSREDLFILGMQANREETSLVHGQDRYHTQLFRIIVVQVGFAVSPPIPP